MPAASRSPASRATARGNILCKLNAPFISVDAGLISESHALLLSTADSKLRYTPNPDSNASASFTYHAWDKTTSENGDFVDLSQSGSTGGATAFSIHSDTATLNVTAINDAPVLSSAFPSLGSTREFIPITIGLGGSFINNGFGTTTITDVDANAVVGGIALVAVSGKGSWDYLD